MCISAMGAPTDFIALGFSEASQMMNHSDIVAAYFTAAGKPVVKGMFSDSYAPNPTGGGSGGYPGGVNTLELTDTSLEARDGHLHACFTRAYKSGHYPIADGGRVIWSRGAVVSDDISYHGADGHDDTGKTQSHRSDEMNPINWLTGGPVCKTSEYVV